MADLDLLVLAALVDPAIATELFRDVLLPNLSRVAARAAPIDALSLPFDAVLTSWQAWVFGMRAGLPFEQVNVAELWCAACGLPPAPRDGRYLVEPAHFAIARDHLRLDDPRALDVTLVEARALAESVEPILADAGWHLDPIEPATVTHWPVSRRDGAALVAPAIDRAVGDNVAAWQPRMVHASSSGVDAALAWRRCVNEIQMVWFAHPVNEAREATGRPTINTLWLSGNGGPRGPQPRYAAVDATMPLLAAIEIEPSAPRTLEGDTRLVEPARAEDWGRWRDELVRLDERIGELLRAQAAKRIGTITMVLCGDREARAVPVAPDRAGGFWRRWGRKPSPSTLFAAAA